MGRRKRLAQTQSGAEGMQSLPALLHRNATEFGDTPAYREKEFGIWQCWTWAEAAKEIRAIALGFLELGVEKGDHIAVIVATSGALLVDGGCSDGGRGSSASVSDSVAEEMAYVLEHCGAKFVVCGDQEQVDKVIEIQENLHQVKHILYTDKRGMRKYDHSQMNALEDIMAEGSAGHARFRYRAGQAYRGDHYDDTCVMLYTSGQQASPRRGAVESECH